MPSVPDKWRYTLYTTLVLLLLFNPWTFQFMSRLLGTAVANKDGCPTLLGFLVHALFFTLILRSMMDLHL
jgi:hypothetical protein